MGFARDWPSFFQEKQMEKINEKILIVSHEKGFLRNLTRF